MGILFLGSIVVFDLFGWFRLLLLAPAQMPAEWIRSIFMALSVLFSTLLFFIMYRYFPHQRVSAGSALAGALLALMGSPTRAQLLWPVGHHHKSGGGCECETAAPAPSAPSAVTATTPECPFGQRVTHRASRSESDHRMTAKPDT